MLYPTANQPLIIVVMFFTGFLSGIFFDIFRFLTYLSGGDKWSRNFFDFLSTIFSFAILFLANLWINYGQFRFYVVVIFFIGFFIERVISKILWTKLILKCYNTFKVKGGLGKFRNGRKQKKKR